MDLKYYNHADGIDNGMRVAFPSHYSTSTIASLELKSLTDTLIIPAYHVICPSQVLFVIIEGPILP